MGRDAQAFLLQQSESAVNMASVTVTFDACNALTVVIAPHLSNRLQITAFKSNFPEALCLFRSSTAWQPDAEAVAQHPDPAVKP